MRYVDDGVKLGCLSTWGKDWALDPINVQMEPKVWRIPQDESMHEGIDFLTVKTKETKIP